MYNNHHLIFPISYKHTSFLMSYLKEDMKITRFVSSRHKARYYYILTPAGIKEKVRLTGNFVKRKRTEYEKLLEG